MEIRQKHYIAKHRSVVEAVFAHTHTSGLCLADETRAVTYSEYCDEILKTVTALRSYGIERGQRVVVEASQTISYLALQLAMNLSGVVFVPVERGCAWNKMLHIAQLSEASALIAGKIKEPDDSVTLIQMDELCSRVAHAEPASVYSFPEPDDVSEILFSTGTTGTEKGIVISFANNIALAENVINGVSMQGDNVEMIPSPLNHSHGLRRYYANMVLGCTVVVLSSVMNVKKLFDMVEQYHVNSFDLVPTALSVILRLSKDHFARYRDVIRYIQLGSAPISEADMATLRRLLPDTRLYNFYGSTESGCICIYDFNTDSCKQKCIGKPACNAHIIVVDEDRRPVQSSAECTGLLASKGPMNMLGYWKDEDATKAVLENGFIYSNDEAYFDSDGDIILLGRKGDVINSGGNKISPDEVEEAAKAHPSVADCGCIGVADALKGSVPKLFVQLRPGHEFEPASIKECIASRLEPYKVPAAVVAIETIPRSFNGKLLRRVLKEHHEKDNN